MMIMFMMMRFTVQWHLTVEKDNWTIDEMITVLAAPAVVILRHFHICQKHCSSAVSRAPFSSMRHRKCTSSHPGFLLNFAKSAESAALLNAKSTCSGNEGQRQHKEHISVSTFCYILRSSSRMARESLPESCSALLSSSIWFDYL